MITSIVAVYSDYTFYILEGYSRHTLQKRVQAGDFCRISKATVGSCRCMLRPTRNHRRARHWLLAMQPGDPSRYVQESHHRLGDHQWSAKLQ